MSICSRVKTGKIIVKGKKDTLALLLGSNAVCSAVCAFQPKNRLNILAYHRILDIDVELFSFDEDLVSASLKEFEKQLLFLSEYCTVITFEELTVLTQNGAKLPPNATIITFDDGFSDNYDNAFPLLKKHGLKAVFFLSTDYIDTNNLFWFDLLAFLGKKQVIQLPEEVIPKELKASSSPKGRIIEWKNLREYMIKAPNQERLMLMDKILAISHSVSEEELALGKPLTWTQVREMRAYGMEFGSHTLSHVVLGNCDNEEIDREIKLSKEVIEQQLSCSVNAISYPIASHGFAVNNYTLQRVKDHNYHWGVSYFSGTNCLPSDNHLMLKRLKVERYTSLARFKSQLFWPELMAY